MALTFDQQHEGIATLWARDKVAALLDQKVTGRDPKLVREDVLKVALTHKIMSPYTSFVAVEKKISRPQYQQSVKKSVPNLMPKGSTMSVPYPRTATDGPYKLVMGLLCSLVLLGLQNYTCALS